MPRPRIASLTDFTPSVATISTPNLRNGKTRSDRVRDEDRYFIAWDGEGANGIERHQHYVLFGCSTGARIKGNRLTTLQCLELIMSVGREHPDAWHVGFAFDYDVNMIIRDLSRRQILELKDKGATYFANRRFRISHVQAKWLEITEYNPSRPEDKFTVKISDTFGFFQQSFVKALYANIPDHPLMAEIAKIEEGKKERNNFTYDHIDYIESYWETEIKLLEALIERLRDMLWDGGFRIKSWHGPGALANYTYKKNRIDEHKKDTPAEVYEASRFAYAGGRFELFRVGKFGTPGRRVYSYDINSAYPAAIANLPSFAEGYWRKVGRVDTSSPESIAEFGVYRIKLFGPMEDMFSARPSPLFHRDNRSCISFPWFLEGWYWSPEVAGMILNQNGCELEIVEGWEFVGWETRPFGFVRDAYNMRKELKAAGDGTEKAYKLMLNSLYGKMAQRVGWERTGHAPKWHQLDWAGYVTSWTRYRMYTVLSVIPPDDLIGVETDGVYTTMSPAELGITDSKELGGWEVGSYDEMLYIQSGMYFTREGSKWVGKYRGLDSGTLTQSMMLEHLQTLKPHSEWPPLVGKTTRFTGYRKALWNESMNMGELKSHMNTWTTSTKEVRSGATGKRVHRPDLCPACDVGATALEMPHTLVIQPGSLRNHVSYPHDIPWLGDDTAEWRDYMEAHTIEMRGG